MILMIWAIFTVSVISFVLGTVTDFRIIYLILSIADVSPIFLQLTLQPLTSVVFDNSSSLSNRAHAVGTFPIFCIV